MTPQEEERQARKKLRDLAKARRARIEAQRRRKREAPRRLKVIESRIDQLGKAYSNAGTIDERQVIRRELRDLGAERLDLKYG